MASAKIIRALLVVASALSMAAAPLAMAREAAPVKAAAAPAKAATAQARSAAKQAKAEPPAQKPAPAPGTEIKQAAASDDYPDKDKLAPVLPPEQFFGAAAMGYAAAKVVPHVCAKLFCYCGCDITDQHSCLLDCFTGMHGADCHICQEEALQALKMWRDERPLSDIQKTIDEGWQAKYPFKEESPALKKYRSTRKWQPGGSQPAKSAGGSESGACCAGK